MSDAPLNAIFAQLSRMESTLGVLHDGQAALRTDLTTLRSDLTTLRSDLTTFRVDLMERLDRLQSRIDGLDDLQTMGFGEVDTVSDAHRLLTEQVKTLRSLYQRLATRVDRLEDPR